MPARLVAARIRRRLGARCQPGRHRPGATDEAATDEAATEEVTASVSVRATGHQRIRLEALPQVVQPGGSVASPTAARAAVVATLRPTRPGRRVQLQVQTGETWRAVATKRQDGRGRVQFAATASVDGTPVVYRVKAMASASTGPVKSAPVSTARWLDATWTDEFDGSHLDPVWNHRGREYAHGSRRSCAKGDPRAVSVGGGAVRLSVVTDPDATTRCRIRGRDARAGRFAYRLNGHIGTQHSFAFRYGVAAARVKFHRLRGQHGAFWLQPTDGMYAGALGSEIDVVEYFGDHHPQGGLASFMHRYEGKRRIASGGWIPNSGVLPHRPGRRVVEELPRLLGGVDAPHARLPHRRQGDRPAARQDLRRPAVPDPEPHLGRLRGPEDQGEAAAPAHVRRLGAGLGDRRRADRRVTQPRPPSPR